jgi:iron-sulfur cluster repair protein YtfE (RIC family)
MPRIRSSDSIGAIAARHHGAREIFERLNVDYYSATNLSLADALSGDGVDVDVVMREIESLDPYDTTPRWDARPLDDLMRYQET